jgi:ribosomal protein S18 acetylase RimI-like enzyme
MVPSSWFNFSDNLPSSGFTANNSLSTTIVRPASLNDLSQIGELLTLSFNNFNDFTFWIYPLFKLGVCQDLRGRIQTQENQAKNSDSLCLVAVFISKLGKEINQSVVGTVELSFLSTSRWFGKQKYAYISNLAVSKNYRRQGIASKLLHQCEIIAQQKNLPQISLHVLASNKIGQEVYFKNGYDLQQVETDLYSLFVTSKRRLLLTKSLK